PTLQKSHPHPQILHLTPRQQLARPISASRLSSFSLFRRPLRNTDPVYMLHAGGTFPPRQELRGFVAPWLGDCPRSSAPPVCRVCRVFPGFQSSKMNPMPDAPLGAVNPLAFRRSPPKITPHSFGSRYSPRPPPPRRNMRGPAVQFLRITGRSMRGRCIQRAGGGHADLALT